MFLARHGKGHKIQPSELNFRANIYGFKTLGVEWLLSASAVGSLKEEYAPLDLLIPDQFFDRTKGRISTFFGNGIVAHVAFAHPFCHDLSDIAYDAAVAAGAKVHQGGTYVCMEGPQFSTRAESLLYRSWGMDIIGMTNLQEAKLAREAEICYATIALITDYDCWHPDHDSVTVEMIIANLTQNARTAQKVIAGAVGALVARTAHVLVRECAGDGDRHARATRCRRRRRRTWRRSSASTSSSRADDRGRRRIERERSTMNIVVTGSIAYDYLMTFPGSFTEHLLPEHLSRISLSFLVDTMDKRRGGCAPNIAYTLALLGERPKLMAHGGAGLRRISPVARSRQHRHVAGEGDRGQVHRVVLLQHRQEQQSDRVVLHRRDGQRRRAVVPHGEGLRAGDHLAERSAGDGPVRGGVPRARHPPHLRSGPAGARVRRPKNCAPAASAPRISSATTTSSS